LLIVNFDELWNVFDFLIVLNVYRHSFKTWPGSADWPETGLDLRKREGKNSGYLGRTDDLVDTERPGQKPGCNLLTIFFNKNNVMLIFKKIT
jgi:hypothetical protein